MKESKWRLGKEYRVVWDDHTRYDKTDWRDANDHDELKPDSVVTLGTLIKKDDDYIILAGNYSPTGHATMHEMCIIRSCIKSVKEIKTD